MAENSQQEQKTQAPLSFGISTILSDNNNENSSNEQQIRKDVTSNSAEIIFRSISQIRTNKSIYGDYRRVGHPYQNRSPPKRKKPRTTFSREQIAELETRFLTQKYLASTERLALASSLDLTDAQVKTWFQNRRTKWRRQTAEEREAERNAAAKYLLRIQQNAASVAATARLCCINPMMNPLTLPILSPQHNNGQNNHDSTFKRD